ncbi:MAG: DNA photolyase [Thermoanaerobaculia bacterium]
MGRTIERIYIEQGVADHPRTRAICRRFPRAQRIVCQRYGEVFNRKAQDFRLQKRRPALILAEKHDHFVLGAPLAYAIGGERNFYFSHMLNCLYDCRYCFLQGMFRSAHYLVFVNYEDFQRAIDERLTEAEGEEVYFFSGYDCDSLAFEGVTRFAAEFLPFFARRPRAWLELRTKSAQVEALLERQALPNCVVAFSFTPEEIHAGLEHGVPSVERRVRAMERLQEGGWRVGLRFDPLIYSQEFEAQYRRLFEVIFAAIGPPALHSVSYGGFRLPKGYYETLFRLYPEERLFAGPLEERGGMVAFPARLERQMFDFCAEELRRYVPTKLLYPCPSAPDASPYADRSFDG